MLNQVVLVGRLVKNPELKKSERDKSYSFITLAIPRAYKNTDGKYDSDFIDCILWDGVAKNTAEYCKKGDIVGVKGRLQSDVKEQNDGSKKYYTNIIAEKITFLSNTKQEEAG